VITGDEVDALLFDVLGTVVDEAGSMRAELASALDKVAAGQAGAERGRAEELAEHLVLDRLGCAERPENRDEETFPVDGQEVQAGTGF
jgi:hypothetical protein